MVRNPSSHATPDPSGKHPDVASPRLSPERAPTTRPNAAGVVGPSGGSGRAVGRDDGHGPDGAVSRSGSCDHHVHVLRHDARSMAPGGTRRRSRRTRSPAEPYIPGNARQCGLDDGVGNAGRPCVRRSFTEIATAGRLLFVAGSGLSVRTTRVTIESNSSGVYGQAAQNASATTFASTRLEPVSAIAMSLRNPPSSFIAP